MVYTASSRALRTLLFTCFTLAVPFFSQCLLNDPWLGRVYAVASLLFPGLPRTAEATTLWVESSYVKVQPNDPVKLSNEAHVSAARNETEAFQVIVYGGAAGLLQVNAAVSDLVGPNARTISSDHLALYREYYVHVTIPSFLGGVSGNPRKRGEYPDPLIPFFDPYSSGQRPLGAPFDVAPGRNQPIYVEVNVPEDCLAGTYEGRLMVTAQGETPVEVPITLTVWDFSIPRERTISTSYGFSWGGILSYHGGPNGQWDPESLAILQHYEDELHRHRVDETDIAQGVENPFHFDADGNLLPVDWSAYDAVVGPRVDGSYFSDGVGVRRFNAGFFHPGGGGMEDGLTEEQYKAAAAEFARHLKEMGWMDRVYVYVEDEPWMDPDSYARIPHYVSLMKEADPAWDRHFLVTNWYEQILDGSIGIWCPQTWFYDNWFLGFLGINFPGRDFYPTRFAKGEELWFYVCLATVAPYAGYDIDTLKAYEPRILMWGSWYEGASGFLYWETNHWQKDAWKDVIDFASFFILARNGDGFLFYPGDHNGTIAPAGSPEGIAIDGPIPSLRLKATRDGMQDWEMFLIASKVAGIDAVRSALSPAYTKLGSFPLPPVYNPTDPPWTYSEDIVRQVREEVAALIVYGTSTTTTSTEPNTTTTNETTTTTTTTASTTTSTTTTLPCTSPPAAPSLSNPTNGAINIYTAANLAWGAVSGATSYDVEVCADDGCSSVVASASDLTAPKWSVTPALNKNTGYFWRVQAINSCGSGPWSSTWNFTTGNCFIATASFGTAMQGKIDVLRSFRDSYLIESPTGKAFVEAYYAHSPPVADYIAHREWLRAAVRILLTPVIGFVSLLV